MIGGFSMFFALKVLHGLCELVEEEHCAERHGESHEAGILVEPVGVFYEDLGKARKFGEYTTKT